MPWEKWGRKGKRKEREEERRQCFYPSYAEVFNAKMLVFFLLFFFFFHFPVMPDKKMVRWRERREWKEREEETKGEKNNAVPISYANAQPISD